MCYTAVEQQTTASPALIRTPRVNLVAGAIVTAAMKVHSELGPGLSYIRLSGKNVGLLINLHVAHLCDGIKRMVDGSDWEEKTCQ